MTRPARILLMLALIYNPAQSYTQQINLLRSLDDNHALASDSSDWKFHRAIKEIPLGANAHRSLLSIGGEVRAQFRFYDHINFGDVDSGYSDRDFYMHQRYMLHADLQLNRFLRFFAQVNSCHVNGKNDVSSETDRDDLGFMQAFGELRFRAPFPVTLRLGRQEFSFGLAERIMGCREGSNVRQSYDGAKISFALNRLSGDFLVVQPVSYQPGAFDNLHFKRELVSSAYFSYRLEKNNRLDIYYFGVRRRDVMCVNDTANETRHSAGLRLSKTTGSFYYDAEVTYQLARFGHIPVRAGQLSAIVGYRWRDLPLMPRLQIREMFLSGDRHSGDNRINTFRPVYSRSPVVELLPIGPANLFVLIPEAEITPVRHFKIALRYYAVRRASPHDGVYSSDSREMTRNAEQSGKEPGMAITNGISADLTFDISKHIWFILTGGYFRAGEYIAGTGRGKSMNVLQFRTYYKL